MHNPLFYDLHIHSVLSPCGSDDMTPNNIVNMSILKELNLIAITDHNSIEQFEAIEKVAMKNGIQVLCGIEVTSQEEVHLICLFKNHHDAILFYDWIKSKRPVIQNDVQFFGKQEIMNEWDEVVGSVDDLLLVSIEASIDAICKQTHMNHGIMIIAHAMDKANSIMTQLGFIPLTLDFDGIEIKNEEQKKALIQMHPGLDTVWFYNSDAHYLEQINEATHSIEKEVYESLWRY